MVDFYERARRMGKDDALRQAQLQVRKKYAHPFHWGAFRLTDLSR
jgi:CHAT domain-containing protein